MSEELPFRKILQIFNRYRERGGEEKSAERIFHHASENFEVEKLWWDSRDWDLSDGPGKLGQLRRLFGNEDSARELRERINTNRPDALLFHNLYPVASPSVYREALDQNVPVIQYIHNFRPFSVGGSCWTGSAVCDEGLRKNFLPEVLAGSWQGSQIKSAIFALMLKRLHASGWLDSVRCWVAISDFMRQKFIEAGIPADRVVTLRHSWNVMSSPPEVIDGDYYLLLARLVPEKGVLEALAAWEGMGKDAPKLLVAGTGPLSEEVEAIAAKLTRVRYIGFVSGDEKHKLIQECRGMVAPSVWWEPLGLVTYESYDYSKPILAAASGGLTETVINGVTGFLHKPGDVESLIRSVEKLETLSSEERKEMGRGGRDWLIKEASPMGWKSSFKNVVDQVVAAG